MTISVVDLATAETIRGPMMIRIPRGRHEHRPSPRSGAGEHAARDGRAPQHVHHRHDETFYVVSGNPRFISAGKQVDARRGTLVTVPPGTPHAFSNPGDEPVEMLCTVTPDLYIAYFRELAQLPAGPPDPAVVGAIMSRYFTDVVRPDGPPANSTQAAP
jgi:mannose-6-phosphate isomerase-like protein (cupin superfamily)